MIPGVACECHEHVAGNLFDAEDILAAEGQNAETSGVRDGH